MLFTVLPPCGSLHVHTGTICLSAKDKAGTYALPLASKIVFRQPTASWAHACPTSLVIHACMVDNHRL